MQKIDWNIYNATHDSPSGPVVINAPDYESSEIEPVRDEDGNITLGGQIGYSLTLIVIIGFFLYFRFAV